MALGHLVRDHRENRCRAAMHDRGAEAANQPSCDVGFGDREQIPNVLDHREPGAHGKARKVDRSGTKRISISVE